MFSPLEPESERVRSILIVGGGTAGWMAAALLARRFERQPVAITVIESPDISTVGVGEATVPAIRDFHRDIGLDDLDVMRATEGTAKLGIEFDGWLRPGHTFFHPFALYGSRSRGVPFHQYWLRLRTAGDAHALDEYNLGTHLARAGLFMPPPEKPSTDFGVFDWALHFDAGLYAHVLRRLAIGLGVRHVEAHVVDVALDGETGFVRAVETREAGTIPADLFIDCSGFRGLLIAGALGEGYEDWSDLLPCDRAVAIPCTHGGPLSPFTRSTALSAGWKWRIPLQHRVGNGYVYSSRHISDDEAVATLRDRLEGEPLAEPNLLRFTTGHRTRFWHKNVVALGLAAGFMEPLESTSIVLIQTGIERLIELFPTRRCDPVISDEYNRKASLEWERVRDFLLLHYWANRREGEPMWDAARAATLPETLARKINLFTARGAFVRYEWESFQDPSWLSLYDGFDLLPATYDPLADYFGEDDLRRALARMREAIGKAAASARPHKDFIAAHCAAVPTAVAAR